MTTTGNPPSRVKLEDGRVASQREMHHVWDHPVERIILSSDGPDLGVPVRDTKAVDLLSKKIFLGLPHIKELRSLVRWINRCKVANRTRSYLTSGIDGFLAEVVRSFHCSLWKCSGGRDPFDKSYIMYDASKAPFALQQKLLTSICKGEGVTFVRNPLDWRQFSEAVHLLVVHFKYFKNAYGVYKKGDGWATRPNPYPDSLCMTCQVIHSGIENRRRC